MMVPKRSMAFAEVDEDFREPPDRMRGYNADAHEEVLGLKTV